MNNFNICLGHYQTLAVFIDENNLIYAISDPDFFYRIGDSENLEGEFPTGSLDILSWANE